MLDIAFHGSSSRHNELVYECRAVGVRPHSNEQDEVTVDLVMLRAQLFLLDVEAANLQEFKRLELRLSYAHTQESSPF